MIPAPFNLEDLRGGTTLRAGLGQSTVVADFDFETYSPAGFEWDNTRNKWNALPKAKAKGLRAISTIKYAEHPQTEILCLAYNLKDGTGAKQWIPGQLLPFDLFKYLASGGLIESWNIAFEYWIWENVCVKKHMFPRLPIAQLRCAMAKAKAFGLPGALKEAGKVLNLTNQKLDGDRLINLFSIPRDPTKKNPNLRIYPADALEDAIQLYGYNLRDIIAEAEASSLIPDLSEFELEFWQCDQKINRRGVAIDLEAIKGAISIIEDNEKYINQQVFDSTNGQVTSALKIAQLRQWLADNKSYVADSLDKKHIEQTLKDNAVSNDVKELLRLRQLAALSSVKKVYAMTNQVAADNRLHDLFSYHSARTGRAAGNGPQPQNLPSKGPMLKWCEDCGKQTNKDVSFCLWCRNTNFKIKEWNAEAVAQILPVIRSGNIDLLNFYFDDPLMIISGCLRGFFIASEGHDLICSDYSAIEAVVLAALAGEAWRLEVFKTHGMIYETSASKITNVPFEEFQLHKEKTGSHHPLRKLGKVAELASGYQGWINGWKNFGAGEFLSDDEIKNAVLAWRAASPNIVAMWGTQYPRHDGLEGIAIQAVLNKNTWLTYRDIAFILQNDILYARIPSGRYLTYHKPRLNQGDRKGLQLSFETWNTNPKYGRTGWTRLNTYGGKLTENVVQAVARDILAHAIVLLERNNYPVVLHVHDEIVCEVPEGSGSIEQMEKIMMTLPSWCQHWPVKAVNGWRAKQYQK